MRVYSSRIKYKLIALNHSFHLHPQHVFRIKNFFAGVCDIGSNYLLKILSADAIEMLNISLKKQTTIDFPNSHIFLVPRFIYQDSQFISEYLSQKNIDKISEHLKISVAFILYQNDRLHHFLPHNMLPGITPINILNSHQIKVIRHLHLEGRDSLYHQVKAWIMRNLLSKHDSRREHHTTLQDEGSFCFRTRKCNGENLSKDLVSSLSEEEQEKLREQILCLLKSDFLDINISNLLYDRVHKQIYYVDNKDPLVVSREDAQLKRAKIIELVWGNDKENIAIKLKENAHLIDPAMDGYDWERLTEQEKFCLKISRVFNNIFLLLILQRFKEADELKNELKVFCKENNKLARHRYVKMLLYELKNIERRPINVNKNLQDETERSK